MSSQVPFLCSLPSTESEGPHHLPVCALQQALDRLAQPLATSLFALLRHLHMVLGMWMEKLGYLPPSFSMF